jgi:putative pyruvate formate lyase activating enzyme
MITAPEKNRSRNLCELCPRKCRAARSTPDGDAGFCRALDKARVFRWGPHFGEEPPLTGEHGSGCVFFSRCTMKCIYCQNSPWSWQGKGEDKSPDELAAIFRELAVDDRCENWNLVSPTPYLPFIREARHTLGKEGIRLPFVWNSSGYERTETLEEYSELCDTALFDLRYAEDTTAETASGAPGYVQAARNAVAWAFNRPQTSSVPLIVRILVLPGHAGEAVENLAWLATELSNEIPISVMSQFTPAYKALETPPFNRMVTKEEYETVTEAAQDFGFENGWFQGFGAADPAIALMGENMGADHGTVR